MKVCIIGSAPASAALAPFNSEWQIWSCSPTMRQLPNVDVAFEIHKYDRVYSSFSQEYKSWLESFPGLVWMMAEYPQVKGCQVLPYKALMKKYSPFFFTSSVAWMMAMALEVASEISLYGVDMACNTEYHDQKMGCQFFATLAKNKGIKVTVPPESDLLRPPPLYGIREYQHSWIKQTARQREVAAMKEGTRVRRVNAVREEQFINGAEDNRDYEMKTWFGNLEYEGDEYCSVPRIKI